MNTYAASNRNTIFARWPFLQLTASAAACSASSRRAWSFVQSRMNVRMFTIDLPGTMALAAAIAIVGSGAAWQAARAQSVPTINARVVATNIPGASAIAQVGTFLNNSEVCSHTIDGVSILYPHPIPNPPFVSFIQPGAVLDPTRILVGNRSNFGAPLALNVGSAGSFLSIDPSRPGVLSVPPNFAQSGNQASTLGGAVQMYSANSPHWLNGVNNSQASTASYTGVSNPLGLSNNNAFGRLWPANAPFGDAGLGSSSILDPDGLPLKGAPSGVIGGVYVGSQTNRNVVAVPQQPQVIPGSLGTGAVGTAFLGPSPDREDSHTCRAVFAVVTADGAIVQEHTQKGLDGLAPAGTVQPLLGRSWGPPNQGVEPRLGVLMNPYTATPNAAWQLFVSEPFNNTIAVVNLVIFGTAPNQVFGLAPVNPVSRITSPFLNLPVDITPVKRDADSAAWASNTTLDEDSHLYVANRGNNTIVRMKQDGSVVAVRRVAVDSPLNNASLNGIATSTDGETIYVTVTSPSNSGLLALPAF
jgi:hypothetical protein